MSIRVACPGCKQPLEAPDTSGGQVMACPRCGQKMRLPEPIPVVIPTAPPPPPPPPPPVPVPADDAPPRLTRRGRDDELSPFLDDDNDVFDPRRRPEGSPIPKHIQLPGDAKVADLGRPVAEFRSPGALTLFWVTAGITAFLLVLMIVMVVVIVLRADQVREAGKFLKRRARSNSPDVLVILPFLGMLVSGGFAVHFLRQSRRRLILCENGFVDSYLLRQETVYWSEVSKLYQKLVANYVVTQAEMAQARRGRLPKDAAFAGMTYEYVLERDRGRAIVFSTKNETPEVEKLGWYLHQFVARTQLPAARQAMASGQWVRFDDISISRQGLAVGEDQLPWAQVGRIEPESGRLCIYEPFRNTSWAEVPIHDVPNYGVFVRLLSEALGAS